MATEIALTKLDVLRYGADPGLHPLPAAVRPNRAVPVSLRSGDAKPLIRFLEGWKCDISVVRRWEYFPKVARDYVTFIEEAVGRPIAYISVGHERDSIIVRKRDNDKTRRDQSPESSRCVPRY